MADQRQNWQAFQCKKDQMVSIAFGPDRILVAPSTQDAWAALASVLLANGYELRTPDTDSYCCREIKGGGASSLHSFGIALDINWNTNPFQMTPDRRSVRFSDKPTQSARAEDVRLGLADTDMTQAMINDALAIKTNSGKTVFAWGGNWHDRKDTMHFELNVSPAELASGIDQSTVKPPPPGATWPSSSPAVGDDSVLGFGASGARVKELQQALAQRSFSVGPIDGIFGSATRSALKQFQASKGLPESGVGDAATLAALGLAGGGTAQGQATTDPALDALLVLLGLKPAPTPTPTPPPADALATLIAALFGKATPPAVPPADAAKAAQQAAMSPIDKMLGGEALTGKKTALAVLAYAALSIVQAVAPGKIGPETVDTLTTLIAAFGGLGLLGKIDRGVNLVGQVAANQQADGKSSG